MLKGHNPGVQTLNCTARHVAMQSHTDSMVKHARVCIALRDVLHCKYIFSLRRTRASRANSGIQRISI